MTLSRHPAFQETSPMESWLRRFITLATTLVVGGVLACGGTTTPTGPASTGGATTGGHSGGSNGGGSNGGGSGGGATSPVTGSLSIRITDSPFGDAKALLVTFSEVNVHR